MSLFISNLISDNSRINTPIIQSFINPIENNGGISIFKQNMDAFQYERIFVQVVEEIAAKKGLNGAQLARLAWPHQRAAATAWRRMRNNQSNPKRLNIEEAFLLTQAIGVSMSDVCGIVQGRMMELDSNSKILLSEKEEKKKNSESGRASLQTSPDSTFTNIESDMEENFEEA